MAHIEYTYLAADLLTNAVLTELPLYGVYFESRLNDVGQFNGTYQLGQGSSLDELYLSSTKPGKSVIYVFENGVLIQGYIIWTRTYQATARSVQMTGQTFESYPYRNIIRERQEYVSVEQFLIYRTLWQDVQAAANADIGVTTPVQSPASGIDRTLRIYPAQFLSYGEVMEEFLTHVDACDMSIKVYESGGAYKKELILGYPKLGRSAAASELVLEYPEGVDNYWYTESAAEGITVAFATGSDEGWDTKWARAEASAKLADGYPILEERFMFEGVVREPALLKRAEGKIVTKRVPLKNITFDINPTKSPLMQDIQLGDDLLFSTTDERFPNGHEEISRILGWTVSVGDGDIVENIQLILRGDNDA